MNKQDIKLVGIVNGFYKKPKKEILSFSLDPITYERFKLLKTKYGRKKFTQYFETWFDSIKKQNYIKNCNNDLPFKATKKYPHKAYKFNSMLTRYKYDIKVLAAINGVTVSSLVRAFINTFEEKR